MCSPQKFFFSTTCSAVFFYVSLGRVKDVDDNAKQTLAIIEMRYVDIKHLEWSLQWHLKNVYMFLTYLSKMHQYCTSLVLQHVNIVRDP